MARESHVHFGLPPTSPTRGEDRGSVSLWLIIWGAVIRNFVRMSTEGDPLDLEKIKTEALRNFTMRASSLEYHAVLQRGKLLGKGKPPPKQYPILTRLIYPLGEMGEDTNVHWGDPYLEALRAAGLGHLIRGGAAAAPAINPEPTTPNRNLITFVSAKCSPLDNG